jgi:acetolactate decarboxylase
MNGWDSNDERYDERGYTMKLRNLVVLLLALILAGCATCQPRNTVTQVCTIDALLVGAYDGQVACNDLLKEGNLGIGTFDRLDGEMVVLDGCVYQVKTDGKIYRPNPDETTPFAAVCRFTPEMTIALNEGSSFTDVQALIDKAVPNPNLFCAFRMHGTFKTMHTRTVPAQQKPYPPLAEVTKNQSEFNMENVTGTIVGFRCPPFVKGVNVPGYHLHFLSDDKTQGGHILDFTLATGEAQVDLLNRFVLQLPEDNSALGQVDLSKDRSEELERVEK